MMGVNSLILAVMLDRPTNLKLGLLLASMQLALRC